MLISVVQSATGIIVRMKILTQATAFPSGLTGLTSASANLIISTIADNEAAATAYTVAGATVEAVTTLGTYAAPTATKCRFKEVDATNHPGVYEMQFANARYAIANSKYLLISIAGTTTNLIQSDAIIQLQTFDPYSTTNPVGTATSVSGSVGSVTGNVGGISGVTFPATVASPTNITAGVITTVTNLTNAPNAGDFTATMKTSLNAATPASVVGAVGSVTGNVAGNLLGGVGGNVIGSVGSVVAPVGVSGDFSATMKTSLNAATPALSTAGNNAITAALAALAVSSAPTAGTWGEAIAFALAGMGKAKITYTPPTGVNTNDGILTVFAVDGVTVLKTFSSVNVDAAGNTTVRL